MFMQNNFSVKVKHCNKKWTMILLLILVPHFKFGLLEILYPTVNYLYDIAKIISGVIVILFCFYQKLKIKKPMVLILLIEAWSFSDAVIHQGITSVSINRVLSVIIVCLIINQFIEKYTGELLEALIILSEILVYVNFISMILNPDGMYGNIKTYWLLGNRNLFSIYIIPGLCYQAIYKKYAGRILRFWAFFLISFLSMIWCGSATGLVMMIVLCVLYLFIEKREFIFNSLFITVFYLASLTLVVFLRAYNWFAPVISALNKELTFSGRTYIWDATIRSIIEKPILGYGDVPSTIRGMKVIAGAGAVSAHNFVLEVMYRNGIIGLALTALLFIYVMCQLYRTKGGICGNSFCIGLACIYIFSLTEFSPIVFYFVMLMGYVSLIEYNLSEYYYSNRVKTVIQNYRCYIKI